MGSADPAVDAEKLHAVRSLAQHPLADRRQLERERGEGVGITQRRGGRERLSRSHSRTINQY